MSIYFKIIQDCKKKMLLKNFICRSVILQAERDHINAHFAKNIVGKTFLSSSLLFRFTIFDASKREKVTREMILPRLELRY